MDGSGMQLQDSEFLSSLREEVLHHKDKRTEFVLRKLGFVAILFGLGSITIEAIQSNWLLFAVPFVSLAYDVYISAEDYKVKRIGTFCRIYRYAAPDEREWEKFVNQHREPLAVWASLVVTAIAAVASAVVLILQKQQSGSQLDVEWFWWLWGVWLAAVVVLTGAVFLYYPFLLRKLPKTHLLQEDIDELLDAPAEDLVGLRDKAIIALLVFTGITAEEAVSLQVKDTKQATKDGPPLHVTNPKSGSARHVPYRSPRVVEPAIQEWTDKAGAKYGLLFWGSAKDKPEDIRGLMRWRMRPRSINKILAKYHIVIDGVARVVNASELRRTYARNLYEDGADMKTLEENLGCTKVDSVLGFVGPIEIRRAERRRPTADQLPRERIIGPWTVPAGDTDDAS